MVHIAITSWYPYSKNEEVQNTYNKQFQESGLPSGVKSMKIYVKPSRRGIQITTYLEIEEGKMDEALVSINEFLVVFHGIEGYNYEWDIVLSQEEALAAQQG